MSKRKRIAVIGGGAAGIAAAHRLAPKHEVVLYEASSSLGGHAHAETVSAPDGRSVQVDTGVLIFNEGTYPSLLQLFSELGVQNAGEIVEMSSCFSDPIKNLNYTLGRGWGPILSHPKNYFRWEIVRILSDLARFRAKANRDLSAGVDLSGVTTGAYLEEFSAPFIENFIWPLTSAIWSLPPGHLENFPIVSLLNYFNNHQLLKGKSPKQWRAFRGTTANYIGAFKKSFNGQIRLGASVRQVERLPEKVRVVASDGSDDFDEVVLATHADRSLALLSHPTPHEKELLGVWSYQDNPVTLHLDKSLLHPEERLWGSWNTTRIGDRSYRISYYLNRIHRIRDFPPIILTLGEAPISASSVVKRMNYRHPIFSTEAVATQEKLSSLNGAARIHFCGSYFGYGFHEDAVRSGFNAAEAALR